MNNICMLSVYASGYCAKLYYQGFLIDVSNGNDTNLEAFKNIFGTLPEEATPDILAQRFPPFVTVVVCQDGDIEIKEGILYEKEETN